MNVNSNSRDTGMGSQDLVKIEQHVEKRISDLEEQLSDKASKQSVAQALHRKLNKLEFDEAVAKKADLADIQRLFGALETKVDMENFNQIIKALDNKADKFEVQNFNPGMDSDVGGKVQKLAAECNDMERKVEDIERTLQRLVKDQDSELENLR